MKKIKLEIIGLQYSQTQSGAYALVLGEDKGKRRLPIIIGAFEAQAIAIELENMTPTRPLTHDLFKSLAHSFKINVDEVIIYNLVEGVFFAKLICNNGDKKEEIDARTSDAIAVAVRFGCPIYTYDTILDQAGILMEDDGKTKSASPVTTETGGSDNLKSLTLEELEGLLTEVLDHEDYIRAIAIRDEIKSRKK